MRQVLCFGLLFLAGIFSVNATPESMAQALSEGTLRDIQALGEKLRMGKHVTLSPLQLGESQSLIKAIEGLKIPPETRAEFEQFFKGCPACRDIVIMTGGKPRPRRVIDLGKTCRDYCAKNACL